MKVTKGQLRNHFSRDTYWSRIHFDSDDGQHSVVLISASAEYFWNLFKTRDFKEDDLEKWYATIIEKWQKYGEKVFEKPVHYDVYATTAVGKENGYEFLKNEITP